MTDLMWDLEDLNNMARPEPQALIKGRWQPKRPENYKKDMLSLPEKIQRAWLVFTGKADCFVWPEDKIDPIVVPPIRRRHENI